MRSILQLFIRHGGLLTLVVLEVLCFFLIASYNDAQREVSSASWTRYSGIILNWKTQVYEYLALKSENERLRNDIAQLQTQLVNARLVETAKPDTQTMKVMADSLRQQIKRPEYSVIPARVISNTINGRSNWMMINRGRLDGVQPNTGVITSQGLAGIVRYVSDDFAMVMSVLHRQSKISAALKNQDYFGSLIWEGGDPQTMTLSDIPYHLAVKPRDTVVVSRYSLLFPEGHMVGTVDTAYRVSGSNFLYIRVNLSQNPAAVSDVYVVNNKFSKQVDALQKAVKDE